MDVFDEEDDDEDRHPVASAVPAQSSGAQPAVGAVAGEWFVERAQYIPLRLTFGERKYVFLGE